MGWVVHHLEAAAECLDRLLRHLPLMAGFGDQELAFGVADVPRQIRPLAGRVERDGGSCHRWHRPARRRWHRRGRRPQPRRHSPGCCPAAGRHGRDRDGAGPADSWHEPCIPPPALRRTSNDPRNKGPAGCPGCASEKCLQRFPCPELLCSVGGTRGQEYRGGGGHQQVTCRIFFPDFQVHGGATLKFVLLHHLAP